jgi:hypothetical protein
MRGALAHAPRSSRGCEPSGLTVGQIGFADNSGKIPYQCTFLGLGVGIKARERVAAFHRQNEVGLCKSSKSGTLCYTVSHLLFGRKKNRNREQAAKSGTSTKRRDGGTGRRSGLKIRRYLVPWGFDSPSRHHRNHEKHGLRVSMTGWL